MNDKRIVFACNLAAMNTEQRARYAVLTKQLFAWKRDVRELADGYAIRLAASEQTIKDVAEFVAYERLCCPFLTFEIAIEGDDLQLRLKGAGGVKEFLQAELGW